MKYWAGYQITINPKYTVIFPIYVYDNEIHSNYNPINNLNKPNIKQFTGEISKQSQVKLRYAISLLNYKSKPKKVLNLVTNSYYTFKINFITLTLPSLQGNISDKEIKSQYLNNFLIQLKNKFGVTDYIWKAETQENGNIHFHITTNTYIPHEKLRNLWNRILWKSGMIQEFYKKHNHYNPNSTDVRSVKNIVNFENYLIKYFCKNEKDKRKIDGKLWDCSNSLNYNNRLIIYDFNTNHEINEYLENNFNDFKISKDYCNIYKITLQELKNTKNHTIIDTIKEWEKRIEI